MTDEQIVIGTVNSLSGPVPGVGASHLAATQAYLAYRNSTGGVCGRQVVLRSGDDGTDNTRNRAIVSELSPKILGFIPGAALGGDGGADILTTQRVPAVGDSITPQLDKVPTYYAVNPPLANYNAVIGKYRYLREQGVQKAAVVWVTAGAGPQEAKRQISLIKAAGINVVLELALPATALSYDSTARSVANSGADYLLFLHADGPSASMAKSMADTGYKLKFAEYIIAYGSNFITLAGSAAEGSTSWIYALPAEDGGGDPEQGTFLKWMRQTAPDASLDTFASRSWASTKLLLETVEGLPGAISRDAILQKLAASGQYDADGMIAPLQVGARTNSGCVIGMVVKGGKWQRLAPATGFLC